MEIKTLAAAAVSAAVGAVASGGVELRAIGVGRVERGIPPARTGALVAWGPMT